MRVLVVNAGSSSLKLQVVDVDGGAADDEGAADDDGGDGGAVVAEAHLEDWDGGADVDVFGEVLGAAGGAGGIDAVGHRVVHGGDRRQPELLDDGVVDALDDLTPLAPLHQPRALAGIHTARTAVARVPHVACFDTAFHATMPAAARTYALPAEWRRRWGLARHGFHGLSHAWASRRAAEIANRPAVSSLVVSCHLGAGASLCAVRHGRSVDTTMGFTPLEGLVMATRSGSVDPGLVLWLLTEGRLSVDDVTEGLERRGGLVGLAGTADLRSVLEARARGDADARSAFDVYVHRLRREVAAMTAALGGLDVLAFTGGVGEHAAEVRAAVVDGLPHLGVALAADANAAATGDADLTHPTATARTVVVTSREDLEVAAEVHRLLT